jgi:hypothetical protein
MLNDAQVAEARGKLEVITNAIDATVPTELLKRMSLDERSKRTLEMSAQLMQDFKSEVMRTYGLNHNQAKVAWVQVNWGNDLALRFQRALQERKGDS